MELIIAEDEDNFRYSIAESHDSLGSISKNKSDDTVYIIREPKNLSPKLHRLPFPSPRFHQQPRRTGNRLKQLWDSLGMVLLVLQLSAHVLSHLRGADRNSHVLVEGSANGSCLSQSSSGYYTTADTNRSYSSPDLTSCTNGGFDDRSLSLAFSIHFLVDVYFLLDLIFRYRWSYYTHKYNLYGPTQRNHGFLRTSLWFVIDILLIFPHGFCWKLFEARPALQLLTIKEGRKRPIMDFFFHRKFRLNVLKLVREHRAERKVIRTLFPWLLPPLEVSKNVSNRPRWMVLLGAAGGKTARAFGWGFRMWRRVQKFSFWTAIIQVVSWVAMSVRAFSRLSPADLGMEKGPLGGRRDVQEGEDSDVD